MYRLDSCEHFVKYIDFNLGEKRVKEEGTRED
jgi:hypothetical protein